MKNKFYLILALASSILTACQDENINPPKKMEIDKKIDKEVEKEKKIQIKEVQIREEPPKEYTYFFENLEKKSTEIHVKEDIYEFTNIKQPIVMVNLFATWCPPCRGQIPHLSNLQKKFKKNLFILSAVVNDDIDNEKLERFIIAQKVKFFISNNQEENLKFAYMITPKLGLKKEFPLPLMILFVNGKYFTHYEGIMPEEMIESDIKQLLKKIKK